MASQLSVYIPRVFPNITKARIGAIFENLNLGRVRQIDLVPRVNAQGDEYNMAFIHMWEWYENAASEHLQEKILDPEREARIVYDDPWYWVILENRNPKPDSQLALEQRLGDALDKIASLQMRVDNLESLQGVYQNPEVNYLDDDEEFETPLEEPYLKEREWEIVHDDEGNEWYIHTPPVNDGGDDYAMPQRQNGDGGAPASPRFPTSPVERANAVSPPVTPDAMRENSSLSALDAELQLMAENDALAMTGALGSESHGLPEWLDSDAAASMSWQELHSEAERMREEFVLYPPPANFESKHPSECPPVNLPLEEGQVEMDPMTGKFYEYHYLDGEHIWDEVTTLENNDAASKYIARSLNASSDPTWRSWWMKNAHSKLTRSDANHGFNDDDDYGDMDGCGDVECCPGSPAC